MERSFPNALEFLRSRSRQRSTAIINTGLPKTILPAGDLAGRGRPPVLGMKGWLQKLGHTERSFANLKIIHVAGTKGKGSTCAYIDSFLRAHGQRTGYPQTIGLYTSPHLISPRERIRINFKPLSEHLFAKYVFEVKDALSLDQLNEGPGYLQLLALVSFHTFIREGVEVAVYEVHHGGEYDATNVITNPAVTAITRIGMDHIDDLGPTIENIAWHKAGILKDKVPAFVALQDPNVLAVLERRASEKGVVLQLAKADPGLPDEFAHSVQRENCSLARSVTDTFLQQTSASNLSQQDIVNGIRQTRWPGRFEIVQDTGCEWFLDGAHNETSMACAGQWFSKVSLARASSTSRVLIFAHMPTKRRDHESALRCLAESLSIPLQCVILTTTHIDEAAVSDEDEYTLSRYDQIWKSHRDERVHIAKTIGKATELARSTGNETEFIHILVTGSLYLVGGVLQHTLHRPPL